VHFQFPSIDGGDSSAKAEFAERAKIIAAKGNMIFMVTSRLIESATSYNQ